MKSEDEKKSLAGAADEQPAAETNGESAEEKPVAPEAVEGEAGACADGAEQPATDAPEESAEEDFSPRSSRPRVRNASVART